MLSSPEMDNEAPSPTGAKPHEQYRNFGGNNSFTEADAELRAYWWSRTPQERMEALEELRIRIYGQEAIDAKIPPIFGVSARCRR